MLKAVEEVDALSEARRQATICNACRYCEGYCDVFPALASLREFSDGDITHLANLCHNCRGCYYACQYTAPHEFDINIPAALAKVRAESWERYAWPQGLARLFQESGVAVGVAAAAGFAALFALIQALPNTDADGFYAYLSHGAMIAIFLPAFFGPLFVVALGVRRYWKEVGGGRLTMAHLGHAVQSAGRLKNLSGGQGQGCNYEKQDRFSNARRHSHQAVLYGYLLCFASTTSGTILHYFFSIEAPYGLLSLPKLFGVPGGILMVIGSLGLMALKLKADPELGDRRIWNGEMGFVVLTFLVATTGLLLYAATGTAAVPALLAIHLGVVLAFFVLTPYTKMVHGFYRFAALVADASRRNRA